MHVIMTHEHAYVLRMQTLMEGWEAARNRRAIFLTCYLMMTRNMIAYADDGGFHDTPWMNALLYRFIEYYFDALDAYDREAAAAPAAWRHAFEADQQPDVHVLQNLMLGVNAHISYDLIYALLDVLRPDWNTLDEAHRAQRYQDYVIVNRVICATLDAVQDGVVERYSPAMNWVDRGFGRLDEWMSERMIARWREDSWESALALLAAPEADLDLLRAEVEARAVRRADAIRGERGLLGVAALI
jgi:hypothetical protein